MDVLRAAQGRLDAVDYGAVKGAWLDAQRLQLVSASLRATPAETRACADALLQALPALHADATPAVSGLRCRWVRSPDVAVTDTPVALLRLFRLTSWLGARRRRCWTARPRRRAATRRRRKRTRR